MTPQPPNILWICTDQQRYDTLGCTGNPFVCTPNLDALAADGVIFDQAFVQNPVCTPSRASFLTGRYPRTTRCRQNGQSIPADEMLVTRLLHDAGYVCGLAGKLHLSVCHPSACPGTERRIDDGYDIFHWSHDPGPHWPTNEYYHWLNQQGVRPGDQPLPDCPWVETGPPEPYHHTTWCAQMAIDFIDELAHSAKPWLFSVNMFDPHHSFNPPASYLALYLERLDEIPLPNYLPGELDDKPLWQRNDHQGAYNTPGLFVYDEMSPHDHRLIRAAYWAMCDLIDVQVGRILAALDRTGQRDNTIVIFMSDHGELLGDHGIYLKGPHFYDCATRVPLIVNWPRAIAGGRRCNDLVELVDLTPTLLDAAGAPRYPGMQGRSLWPLLCASDGALSPREDVYCEFYNANFHHQPQAYGTMLRTHAWKLVAYHGQGPAQGELYDLRNDPEERFNRWADPSALAVKSELLRRLCDRMAFTMDPLPERQGPW